MSTSWFLIGRVLPRLWCHWSMFCTVKFNSGKNKKSSLILTEDGRSVTGKGNQVESDLRTLERTCKLHLETHPSPNLDLNPWCSYCEGTRSATTSPAITFLWFYFPSHFLQSVSVVMPTRSHPDVHTFELVLFWTPDAPSSSRDQTVVWLRHRCESIERNWTLKSRRSRRPAKPRLWSALPENRRRRRRVLILSRRTEASGRFGKNTHRWNTTLTTSYVKKYILML